MNESLEQQVDRDRRFKLFNDGLGKLIKETEVTIKPEINHSVDGDFPVLKLKDIKQPPVTQEEAGVVVEKPKAAKKNGKAKKSK